MDKDFSDVAGGILDLLNNAGADPSEALSVLLTCAGNLGYDSGIDGHALEEGAASAIQSIYMQRDRIDRGTSYDISRLRADMMRHSTRLWQFRILRIQTSCRWQNHLVWTLANIAPVLTENA